MARLLRRYLIVTGVLAALVLAVPAIVILGMFALIVPGVILGVMPTAFLWGALFAIVWYPARHRAGEWGAAGLAGIFAAAILLGVPALMNVGGRAAITALRAEDKEPSAPIAMAGVLRIEREANTTPVTQARQGEARSYACDDLCAAALFTPGVSAVILAASPDQAPVQDRRKRPDLTATYRLTPRPADGAPCPAPVVPVERSGRFDPWPGLQALRVSWKLALSTQACLGQVPPDGAPDWTLRMETGTLLSGSGAWGLPPIVKFNRVTIADRSGEVVRRTAVSLTLLQRVLWIEPTGGLENFRFGWARRSFTEAGFEDAAFLSRTTNLGLTPARSAAAPASGADIRGALRAALDNPNLPAGEAALTLVRSYLEGFSSYGRSPDVRPEDPALLVRLLSDPRVRDLSGIYYAIKALGPDSLVLREPMVSRVLAARYPGEREPARLLGAALSALPDGVFATRTRDEERLLDDKLRRRWATGLIRRQADRGAAAGSDLARIISESHAGAAMGRHRDEPDRLDDARAAVEALCLVGPDAAPVLPSLEPLIESGTAPARIFDGDVGRLALARMGKPVESFRKPESLSGTQEGFEDRLRGKLARFRPEFCR